MKTIKHSDKPLNRPLSLSALPISSRTISIGDSFMMSDTLDNKSLCRTGYYSGLEMSGIYNTPFKLKFNTILICTRGKMSIRLGMRHFDMKGRQMLFVIEGALAECLSISDDAGLVAIVFSNDLGVMDSSFTISHKLISDLYSSPLFDLSEEESSILLSIYRMLRHRLSDNDFAYKMELAANVMRSTLCYILPPRIKALEKRRISFSHQELTAEKFLRLIDTYAVKEHKLSFYADQLCISAKHLGRIVSIETGRSAGQWIDVRLTLEAKVLLKDKSLSIQQISEMLNFANQSHFGTFFRRHAGMSPSAYRELC